jgi:hypothetical protein
VDGEAVEAGDADVDSEVAVAAEAAEAVKATKKVLVFTTLA